MPISLQWRLFSRREASVLTTGIYTFLRTLLCRHNRRVVQVLPASQLCNYVHKSVQTISGIYIYVSHKWYVLNYCIQQNQHTVGIFRFIETRHFRPTDIFNPRKQSGSKSDCPKGSEFFRNSCYTL